MLLHACALPIEDWSHVSSQFKWHPAHYSAMLLRKAFKDLKQRLVYDYCDRL